MKKQFLWLFFVIISIAACQNEDNMNRDFPFNIENITSMDGVNIYLSKETMKASTEIKRIR